MRRRRVVHSFVGVLSDREGQALEYGAHPRYVLKTALALEVPYGREGAAVRRRGARTASGEFKRLTPAAAASVLTAEAVHWRPQSPQQGRMTARSKQQT